MKHLFFYLFILLSSSVFSQGFFDPTPAKTLDTVKLIVTYSHIFTPDSLNPKHKNKADVVLFIGQNISLFQCLNSFNREIFLERSRNLDELRQRILRAPTSTFQARFFKNYPIGKITTTDRVMPDNFIFYEKLNQFPWKISSKTSKIGNYTVQKATVKFGGRSWIAWFAPDIPISDGPHKFNGLPGLILKLYDTQNHFVFEFKSIEKPVENLLIELPKLRYIKTTKANFQRARKAFRQSIMNQTFEFITDPNARRAAAENMRRMNNPIMLRAE